MSLLMIKQLDFFSLPFQFSLLNNDKKKKTIFGGVFSIVIIILSISYFLYLSYLYLGNLIQPSIITLNDYYGDQFQMNLSPSQLAFKTVLSRDVSIVTLQAQEQKIYIMPTAFIENEDADNNTIDVPIQILPCGDEDIKDYVCLNYTLTNPQKENSLNLTYYPVNYEKNKIKIYLNYCKPEFLVGPFENYTCASRDEIRQKIVKATTSVLIRVTTMQFNTSKMQYEKRIKQEQFPLSEGLVYIGKFSQERTTTVVNQGFLIQNEESSTYFSGYTKSDFYSTYDFQQQELGLDLLGLAHFFISESGYTQRVQFPQATSLLAEFSSALHCFLLLGIVCKKLSESEIVQDLIEIHLKLYYKKTALNLVDIVEKSNNKEHSNSSASDLLNLNQKIQSMDYKYFIQKYLNIGFFKRLKLFLSSFKENRVKQSDPPELQLYKKLVNSTQKSISIYDIQKELLKIKMMMRMMFTVEQYAAMQLCGLSLDLDEGTGNKQKIDKNSQIDQDLMKKYIQEDNYEERMSKKETNQQIENCYTQRCHSEEDFQFKKQTQREIESQLKISKSSRRNHLEQIEHLEQDQSYFRKCLDDFLNRNQLQSQLDKRILDCMIGRKQTIYNIIPFGQQSLTLDYRSKQTTSEIDRQKQQTMTLEINQISSLKDVYK